MHLYYFINETDVYPIREESALINYLNVAYA